jgi:formylmethanofuran dehydrogenase subunit E
MLQYPGATIPAICNDCHREYLISKKEYDTPDAVCRECFEALDGMTFDELISNE